EPLAAGVARPVEQLTVEGDGDRAAGVDSRCGDGAEAREGLRELEARQPDAVAGLPAVDRDEDDPTVRELPHAGPRVALADLVVCEVLERAEHRLAVPNQHRPTAERGGDAGPGGLQDQARGQRRPDRRL